MADPSPTLAPPTNTALPAPPVTAPPTEVFHASARMLNIPLHRQEHTLSCETAALKMAMGALGVDVPEADLLAQLDLDLTPRSVRPDGSIVWGDPDRGFVGSFDGVFARDGYGVYQGPIAKLAVAHGFSMTTNAVNVNPDTLYSAIRQGFPSVVWMPYDRTVKGRSFWTTPAGKRIDYVVTEHAVVLAGVDATGVTYADPYTASLVHASYQDFEATIAILDGRAVIVRP